MQLERYPGEVAQAQRQKRPGSTRPTEARRSSASRAQGATRRRRASTPAARPTSTRALTGKALLRRAPYRSPAQLDFMERNGEGFGRASVYAIITERDIPLATRAAKLDNARARAHVAKRARELGCGHLLPAGW
jgi:hypothetical protein